MAGTIPVDGNLSMDNLAATMTSEEQLGFERLTALAVDTTQPRNLATFDNEQNQLGKLAVVAKDAASPGTKILSANVYISAIKTDVDVYRLPLTP